MIVDVGSVHHRLDLAPPIAVQVLHGLGNQVKTTEWWGIAAKGLRTPGTALAAILVIIRDRMGSLAADAVSAEGKES